MKTTTTEQAPRILIARTQPAADRWVAALAHAKLPAIACPVMDVTAVDSPCRSLARIDLLIFVSAHAVANVPSELWFEAKDKPCFAVGAATANALQQHNIVAFCPDDESSEGLLALPALQAVAGRQVALFCGRGGRTLLQDELQRRGAEVHRYEVYERLPLAAATLSTCWRDSIDTIYVASVEALQALVDAAVGLAMEKRLFACWLLVPSQRIQLHAQQLGFHRCQLLPGNSVTAAIALLSAAVNEGS